MKNKLLEDLLQKEMDRREFLKTLGVGVIGIIGFNSFLSMLLNSRPETVLKPQPVARQRSKAFGTRRFGV